MWTEAEKANKMAEGWLLEKQTCRIDHFLPLEIAAAIFAARERVFVFAGDDLKNSIE